MIKIKLTKLRSSAIIIALVVGMIMSVVMIGSSLIVGQRLQISAQSRQGKLAYRAALSGVNDGMMLIKQAIAQSKLDAVVGQPTVSSVLLSPNASSREIRYEYNISSGAISSFPSRYKTLTIGNLRAKLTQLAQDNAVSAIGATQIEEFSKVNADNVVDIDIPDTIDPSEFRVYFSRPHYYDSSTGLPTYFVGYYTAMNARLIDVSKSSESQVVYETTSKSETDAFVSVNTTKIDLCKTSGKCKLRIRPQVVKKGTAGLSGDHAGDRTGKFIYLAVLARDSAGLIGYGDSKPGVVMIESVGYAGQAARKLQAKVDTTTGTYLGLFDFGIYCGDKCQGRGIDGL